MSVADPQTLSEWDAYFARYSGRQLRSKAEAMNKMSFIAQLKREGYAMKDITEIMATLARRLMNAGFRCPDGVIDMMSLVDGRKTASTQPQEDFNDSDEPDSITSFLNG